MFTRRLFIGMVWNTLVFGTALFWPAGTFDWWRAWILLGVIAVSSVITMVAVFRTRPDLLRERLKGVIQKGQPIVDRFIVVTFVFAYGMSIAFIPLDVFHFHLLPKPNIVVSSFGLLLVVAGWWIISLVFRENAFAVPVVRHQTEREHHVIDTGVYAVVRHPMYAGIFLFNVGMALWLESYAAAIATLVPIGLLALRIVFEERFLRRELPGYDAYAGRVRYRLLPYVW
ncbi:MAG TPA: isoprenylcysteine carboxylmethyltransferase family protein [Lacipirellulaceae bacterium]|jgi:protein-S-isoprenylcysteine O-methyltransferase Ste14|nr:isoprenylcysteine carboxylmethyltransferase family protein [Lacipirellulaceae bacterium]